MQLMVRDGSSGPFLSQVINNAKAAEQLSDAQLQQIKSKAVLMSLKFADKFYNKHKMHLLEQAAYDVIGVVSLGLLELSDKDPSRALALLLAPEGLVKPFQKGWNMLSTVSRKAGTKSLYGEVDAQLLQQVSSTPDAEDWPGWQQYQQALAEHQRSQSMQLLLQQFFARLPGDDYDYCSLEEVLAEVVFYRALTGGDKVRQDLKQRLTQITLQPHWFNDTFFALQTEATLAELPPANAQAIRADLGQHFAPALLRTLQFAKDYQALAKQDASPEKLDNFEGKQGLSNPLLGWPQYLVL
ncbi:cold adaptation protein AtcC [Arsukibacterium sp.]|uniref:cold adaptation protein AtcC n=1 Tax=Arsukibacterium sp. TaxID=1977258 RepID=UPI002FD99F9B